MIEINGKEYRNLIEQVEFLSDKIYALIKQLPYNGPYDTLDDIPEDVIIDNGTYLVGTEPYTIYKYDENTDEFISLGYFGAKGDKGDKGDTGATGAAGEKGDKGNTGAAAGFGTPVINVTTVTPVEPATGTVTASGDDTAKVFTFDFEIPQGFQGEDGQDGQDGLTTAIYVNGQTYEQEEGTITLPDYPTSLDWDDIQDKPTFATVATSGSYDDLTDKPDLSDVVTTNQLSTVAFSGNYVDLSNKPNLANYVTTNTAQDITAKKDFITGNAKTEVSGSKVKITSDTAHPSSQIRTTLDNNGILHEITDSSLSLYEFAITTDYLDNLNTYIFSKNKSGVVAVTSDIPKDVTNITISGASGTLSATELALVTTTPEKAAFINGTNYLVYCATGTTNVRYGMVYQGTNTVSVCTLLINKTSGAWTYAVTANNIFSGSYTDLTDKPSIPSTATSTTTLTPTTQTLIFTKADLSQESIDVITAVTASTTTTLS